MKMSDVGIICVFQTATTSVSPQLTAPLQWSMKAARSVKDDFFSQRMPRFFAPLLHNHKSHTRKILYNSTNYIALHSVKNLIALAHRTSEI